MNKTTIVDIEQVEHPSFRHGFWFFFDVEDAVVASNGSSWSGMERVYVNNEMVSELRNLTSRQSEHRFSLNGAEYVLQFEVTSMLKGVLVCTLLRDNTIVEVQEKSIHGPKDAPSWQVMLGQLLGGFVTGFGLAYLITEVLLG